MVIFARNPAQFGYINYILNSPFIALPSSLLFDTSFFPQLILLHMDLHSFFATAFLFCYPFQLPSSRSFRCPLLLLAVSHLVFAMATLLLHKLHGWFTLSLLPISLSRQTQLSLRFSSVINFDLIQPVAVKSISTNLHKPREETHELSHL